MPQTENTSAAVVGGCATKVTHQFLVGLTTSWEEEERVVVVLCPYMKSILQSQ